MRSALLALVFGACGSPPGTPIFDPTAWALAPELDPMPEHRETDEACEDRGLFQELGGYEIDTDGCPYGVVSQPLLVNLRAGQELDLLAWHNELLNPEPATGHMLLTVGDTVLFEWQMDIPAEAEVRDERIIVPDRLYAGDSAVLHVHNHGANVYHLNQVTIAE